MKLEGKKMLQLSFFSLNYQCHIVKCDFTSLMKSCHKNKHQNELWGKVLKLLKLRTKTPQ